MISKIPGVGVGGRGRFPAVLTRNGQSQNTCGKDNWSQNPYVVGGEWLAENSQSSSLYSPWSPQWYDSLPPPTAYQLPPTFKFTPGKSKKPPNSYGHLLPMLAAFGGTPGKGARGSWPDDQLLSEPGVWGHCAAGGVGSTDKCLLSDTQLRSNWKRSPHGHLKCCERQFWRGARNEDFNIQFSDLKQAV